MQLTLNLKTRVAASSAVLGAMPLGWWKVGSVLRLSTREYRIVRIEPPYVTAVNDKGRLVTFRYEGASRAD